MLLFSLVHVVVDYVVGNETVGGDVDNDAVISEDVAGGAIVGGDVAEDTVISEEVAGNAIISEDVVGDAIINNATLKRCHRSQYQRRPRYMKDKSQKP